MERKVCQSETNNINSDLFFLWDNLRKCKHLFLVGSLPQQTLETAMRYKGIREPVPSSY
jgi:hypothetical protein